MCGAKYNTPQVSRRRRRPGARREGRRAAKGVPEGQVTSARVSRVGCQSSHTRCQVSGVGDAAGLAEKGVAPRRHLPGVGANLHDHLQLRSVYRLTGAQREYVCL